MRLRLAGLLLALGALGLVLWRGELFTVSRPGDAPRPLERATRAPVPAFAVSLPRVPVGIAHVASTEGPWLVHYWAPWERHGRTQVLALDSLMRTLPGGAGDQVKIAVVCFDPFPSVARFAARLRLGVPVLLDHRRELQAALPCPSIPYTWLLDPSGRVLASQPGEVDWHAPATRALLEAAAAGARAVADSAMANARTPDRTTPRRLGPPGHSGSGSVQARTTSAVGRANQRESSAWPPNRTAL